MATASFPSCFPPISISRSMAKGFLGNTVNIMLKYSVDPTYLPAVQRNFIILGEKRATRKSRTWWALWGPSENFSSPSGRWEGEGPSGPPEKFPLLGKGNGTPQGDFGQGLLPLPFDLHPLGLLRHGGSFHWSPDVLITFPSGWCPLLSSIPRFFLQLRSVPSQIPFSFLNFQKAAGCLRATEEPSCEFMQHRKGQRAV